MRECNRWRGRERRSRLIDELCEMCGYERKHAIKLLNGKLPIIGEARRASGDDFAQTRKGGFEFCHGQGDGIHKIFLSLS